MSNIQPRVCKRAQKQGLTHSALLYQILQYKNIGVVTANSSCFTWHRTKDKCLFKLGNIEKFKFDQMTLKVNSYYHQKDPARHGAHRHVDFNGLQPRLNMHMFSYWKKNTRVLELFMKELQRENYESQWKRDMKDGSVVTRGNCKNIKYYFATKGCP